MINITKIITKAVIITLVNLLFCLKSDTRDDAKIVRKDKKKGNIIKLKYYLFGLSL